MIISFQHIRSLSLAAVFLVLSPVAMADIILQEGHVDLAVSYENGSLRWYFDAGAGEASSESGAVLSGLIDPSSMAVRVSDQLNFKTPPDGLSNQFTGYSGGESFFELPTGALPQGVKAPFLGWAWGPGLEFSDWEGELITVELIRWVTPDGGHFSSWISPTVRYLSTSDPSLTNQNVGDKLNSFALPGHDHFNWGFTEAGIYDLTFRASGIHVTHGELSAESTFRFLVGSSTAVPEPTSMALLFSGLGCTFVVRKYLKKKASPST